MNIIHRIKVVTILASASLCGVAASISYAASVDSMAFTGELLGGQQDGVDVTSLYATVTTPPRYPWAMHVEAVSDDAGDDTLQGIGAHFYFKQAEWGLVGITTMKASIDLAETDEFPAIKNLEVSTYGFEAEGRFTNLVIALQSGMIDSDDVDFADDTYTKLELNWDASESWSFVAGSYKFAGDSTNFIEADYSYLLNGYLAGAYVGATWDAFENVYVGLEFGPASMARTNWKVFAEYNNGEDNYDAVFLGVRFEFGPADSAPILSVFDRNTGGYSFGSTKSSSMGGGKGMM